MLPGWGGWPFYTAATTQQFFFFFKESHLSHQKGKKGHLYVALSLCCKEAASATQTHGLTAL